MKVKGNTIEYKGYEVKIHSFGFHEHESGASSDVYKDCALIDDHDTLEEAIAWIDEQGVKSEGD